MTNDIPMILDCFTVREVAEILNVHPGRVRWWIHQGRMRVIRSKPYMIHIDDAKLPPRGLGGPDVAGRPAQSGRPFRGKAREPNTGS